MTDNIDKPQGGETDKPQGGTSGLVQGTGEVDLLGKIAELERDNKKYRDERKAIDAATKKADEERLTSQAKWQELAEGYKAERDQLQPVAAKHEVISAAFNEMLEGQLKEIPSDVRKRVIDPVRATMDPVAFSKWLRDNSDTFRARQAPNLDGGAGGIGTGGTPANMVPSPKDIVDASRAGIPIDRWMIRRAESDAQKNQQE